MGIGHREDEAGDDDLTARLQDLEGDVRRLQADPQGSLLGPDHPQLGLGLLGLLEHPAQTGGHVEAAGQEALGLVPVGLHDRAHDGAALLDLVGLGGPVGRFDLGRVAGDVGADGPLDHLLPGGHGAPGHDPLLDDEVRAQLVERRDVGFEPGDVGQQLVQLGPHGVPCGPGPPRC